jgi:hypothetical protein
MLAVPAMTPQRLPPPKVTVAIDVLPLLHVPPDGVPVSVAQAPAHMLVLPLIAVGRALTSTEVLRLQPEGKV